ncbi:MAG: hypothetical protein Q8O67_03485 [Deltaproteobacteria bacterium]|nr:hypothetical protein [Deltaproteobacteria bacterium]
MRLVHGGLALDLPEGWSDQSTLLFTAPVDDVPLPTAKRTTRPTESLAVTFGLAGSDDADAVVREEVEKLRAADPALELVEVRPFTGGLGTGSLAVVRLSLAEIALRQLTVAVVVGPVVIRATVSCVEGAFARREPALIALLQSIGFSQSTSSTKASS